MQYLIESWFRVESHAWFILVSMLAFGFCFRAIADTIVFCKKRHMRDQVIRDYRYRCLKRRLDEIMELDRKAL